MSDYYLLVGQTPVPAEMLEWADWFEHHRDERIVSQQRVGPFRVSTIFMGLDHAMPFPGARKQLFETMIFLLGSGNYQTRCATWDEAEEMHRQACAYARSMWRRPITLLRWIREAVEAWMFGWNQRFGRRYPEIWRRRWFGEA